MDVVGYVVNCYFWMYCECMYMYKMTVFVHTHPTMYQIYCFWMYLGIYIRMKCLLVYIPQPRIYI
jgi:hypothetical protein